METAPRQEEKTRTQVGQGWKRVEDQRLLTGKGRFIDDLEPVANIAHAAILRGIQAHARITSIDTSEAEEAPGVFGALPGEDVREMSEPFPLAVNVPVNYYSMVTGKVRYVGEPVAVVVAENRYVAEDAAELLRVVRASSRGSGPGRDARTGRLFIARGCGIQRGQPQDLRVWGARGGV